MTAADRPEDGLTGEVERVLAEHRITHVTGTARVPVCACGRAMVVTKHEAHVAEQIAAVVRRAQAEALREAADALNAVPDYAPSDYDQGRVDQRHADAIALYERADRINDQEAP